MTVELGLAFANEAIYIRLVDTWASLRFARAGSLGLLALLLAPWHGVATAGSLAEPVTARAKPAADGGLPAPGATGRPVCVRVGTRSEGWAWPNGRFIHWAKCKGVVPLCQTAGPGHDVEGWYAHGVLIAPDRCGKSGGQHR